MGGSSQLAGVLVGLQAGKRMAMGSLREGAARLAEVAALPSQRVLVIILIGLAVRLLVAPWTSWTQDVYPYYVVGTNTLDALSVYDHAVFTYPPLFAAMCSLVGSVLSVFQDPSAWGAVDYSMVPVGQLTTMVVPFITSPEFNLAMKAPVILADLATGLALFYLVRDKWGAEQAEKVLFLWFLNPLVIFVSSVHGQFDSLPALMTVLATLFFYRQQYLLCGTAIGLGVMLKIYPLFLVPFYLAVLLLRWKDMRSEGRSLWDGLSPIYRLLAGGAASAALAIPFLVSSTSFIDFLTRRAAISDIGGLNVWSVLGSMTDPKALEMALGTDLAALILVTSMAVAVVLGAVAARSLRGGDADPLMVLALGNVGVLTTTLFLQPVTNPQHLLWLFPFLCLLAVRERLATAQLFMLTVIGILYLVSLQSFWAYLYPAARYGGWASVGELNARITDYYASANGTIPVNVLVITMAVLGALVLLSLLLRRQTTWLVSYLRSRSGKTWEEVP